MAFASSSLAQFPQEKPEDRTKRLNVATSLGWQELLDERSFRVDLNRVFPYQPMYENRYETRQNFSNALRGVFDDSVLSKLFFSHENIENVDRQLRYAVYLQSNKQFKLGPQDKTELVIIMRSIFLNYAKHMNCQITQQISILNTIVVQQTVPHVMSAAKQYLRYLEDANESLKIIMPRSINVSNKGIKVLDTSSALGFNVRSRDIDYDNEIIEVDYSLIGS